MRCDADDLSKMVELGRPRRWHWLLFAMVFSFSSRYSITLAWRLRQHSKPLFSSQFSTSAADGIDKTYEFIDCGNGQRLERFGAHFVKRSCPSSRSIRKNSSNKLWNAPCMLTYTGKSGEIGQWTGTQILELQRDPWQVRFGRKMFTLGTLSMGQVGVFPEQQPHWDWIEDAILHHLSGPSDSNRPFKVLNAFAYTGGSTLAALVHENVQVTHLDASKSAMAMAKANVELSQCQGTVRWIVDDCMTFIQREINRGVKYDAVILDPPAFGRFESKSWQLARDLPVLLSLLPKLLSDTPLFVLLTCHDPTWSSEALERALRSVVPRGRFEAAEMVLAPRDALRGTALSLGMFARWAAQ